ncbi:uncharacterized protein B0H18DRAFT_872467 [Fomitopsis serialis]|uniref:uncharacterized protein n=1 Tax=Fomitopsis serialis TaxID=139415 RepID=UPI0020082D35|nr:uncharacterized protein B0H18DRAFT_872467 [Neoantrodia serialis]KAH9930961.1 hypothetical protein B0H18DRAFT_872467 [Neoantrodia serialis]
MRTIDDTYGDSVTGVLPTYGANWNAGQTCSGCAVQPSPSGTYRGTWHDTTSDNPNSTTGHAVTLEFTGTAISVYCILVNSGSPYVTIASYISFEMDGDPAGTYTHNPDTSAGAAQYVYNATVFSQTGLSNASHTLLMNATQGSQASLVLFDWAMYT